ncbi:MAG: DNA repair protein RecO [Bacteroidetes bacterium]|nr:DNA repair protein RecO [Bacteroidota bacterium]
MLHQSKGIVLSAIKYGDSGFIVKILTQEHGLTAFLVQGVYGKRANIKPAALQPLTLIDAVYYFKDNRQIQRLKELKCQPVLVSTQSNVLKSALAIFCAEVALKALQNQERDQQNFDFLYQSILALEKAEGQLGQFAVDFLLNFSKPLGFFPQNGVGAHFYLDQGVFSNVFLAGNRMVLSESLSQALKNAMFQQQIANGQQRRELLDVLLLYYELHLEGFGMLKSLAVLKSTFN